MSPIPDKAQQIMRILLDAGARDVLIVGGFVRDRLLGIQSKDNACKLAGNNSSRSRGLCREYFDPTMFQ